MKVMAVSDLHHQPVRDPSAEGSGPQRDRSVGDGSVSSSEVDIDQITERLQWTLKQRDLTPRQRKSLSQFGSAAGGEIPHPLW